MRHRQNGVEPRGPHAFVVNSFSPDAVLGPAYAAHFRLFSAAVLDPLVDGLAKASWEGEVELYEPRERVSWRRRLSAKNLRTAQERGGVVG
jgi:hypothetical protein